MLTLFKFYVLITFQGDDGFYEDIHEVTIDMMEVGPVAYRHKKAVRPQQNMVVIEEDGEELEEEKDESLPDWMRPGTALVSMMCCGSQLCDC